MLVLLLEEGAEGGLRVAPQERPVGDRLVGDHGRLHDGERAGQHRAVHRLLVLGQRDLRERRGGGGAGQRLAAGEPHEGDSPVTNALGT